MSLFNPLKVRKVASAPVVQAVGDIIRHHQANMTPSGLSVTRDFDRVRQWEMVSLETHNKEWKYVILVFNNDLTISVYHQGDEIKYIERNSLASALESIALNYS